jgi:asparagine synthase (glutamine-hydrolysing)
MCGITGFLTTNGSSTERLAATAALMADQIAHRGPDDSGVWTDAQTGVAFAFRRLSILDLSSAGHQPMISASGRYVIVFNGEIYNFEEIRRVLEPLGRHFRGHSDTEVMLSAFEEWGLETAVKKFTGMFAFALWDRQERTLSLARDRVGIKPMYYGWSGGTFLFASELKSLHAHPDFRPEIDREALALFMRHNYIPAPYSIYKGIHKLLPGCIVNLRNLSRPGTAIEPVAYWSAKQVAEDGARNPFQGSDDEALRQLDDLLSDSVRLRMISDVPVGAFLSGGIDSSLIVALMQKRGSGAVRTFSIGFSEAKYNEAVQARKVAAHLGTDHVELYVTPREAQDVIPKLPFLYDEPFSDASQIPTYLVSALARRHVVVSLSGDGGDELFGGYDRYLLGQSIWKKAKRFPKPMRRLAGSFFRELSSTRNGNTRKTIDLLRSRFGIGLNSDGMRRLSELLLANSPEESFRHMVSHWTEPERIVMNAHEPPTMLSNKSHWPRLSGFVESIMFQDFISYLPEDILAKVDRASMGVSLEVRVPLLDHRVVEFSARLPLSMKIRDGQGKWPLRQLLYRYVPQELVDRPKWGFNVPMGDWLRGPLREWAEDLLQEDRLKREGYLHPQEVRRIWAAHLSGTTDYQYHLWDVLSFQCWLSEWGPNAARFAAPRDSGELGQSTVISGAH